MKKSLVCYFSIVLFLFTTLVTQAGETLTFKGIQLEKKQIENNIPLNLKGFGVRNKWFFDLYVAALYVDESLMDADANTLINSTKPSMFELHIISDKITSDKMINAVKQGFKATQYISDVDIFKEQEALLNLLKDKIVKGDIFQFSWVPTEGLTIFKNQKKLKSIKSPAFKKRLFAIWLGKDPADKNLKKDLLNDANHSF